jgi:hypothetical protein
MPRTAFDVPTAMPGTASNVFDIIYNIDPTVIEVTLTVLKWMLIFCWNDGIDPSNF